MDTKNKRITIEDNNCPICKRLFEVEKKFDTIRNICTMCNIIMTSTNKENK